MSYTITRPPIGATTPLASTPDLARQMTAIKRYYQASDWHRVESYLQSDPASADLLVEAECHIQGVFGSSVKVLLDVTPDPSGADLPFLYARVWTGEPRRELSKKLHQFDEAWWLDASAGADARLEFAVATQPVEEKAVAF